MRRSTSLALALLLLWAARALAFPVLIGHPQRASANLPVVTIVLPVGTAAEQSPLNPGILTVNRGGNTELPLTVLYELSGTADNGIDYETLTGQYHCGEPNICDNPGHADHDGAIEGDET